MRQLRGLVFAIVAFALALAMVPQAQSQSLLTRHVRDVTVSGQAKYLGHHSSTEPMRLVLVLPLRNQAELEDFLKKLYDPSSASYHKFLTVEEFTARFGPTQEDYDAVIRFATAKGLNVVGTSRNRLNVDVSGSVASIEEAFHLTLGVYQHPTENRTFYSPDHEPTTDLAIPLWHIVGLDNYSTPHPAGLHKNPHGQGNATIGSGPSSSFLGSDMRSAYYGGPLTGSGQSLGLVEFYGTDLADLNTYYKNAGQTNNVPITLDSVDGTSTSCTCSLFFSGSCFIGCDDTEQTLDMTQALGMAPGLSSLVMYIGSNNPLNDAGVFNAMATANPLNAQLSCSWAWKPADPATDDVYFKEFAAQGQNLFQATGDSAAWPNSSGYYFPAEDTYLTAVGGTDLTTSGAGGPWASETAWLDGGGGISPDGFAIPSWQTTAASECSSCSKTLRNGPDVSANANFTFYVCADQTSCTANQFGGTSFAAPMWAGYLALVNQQSVANTGKPVGFINPSLYSIGAGSNYSSDFHDVTSGSNGYSATVGYDLATGWGSPNGSGLVNALAGNPTADFSLSASPGSVSVAQGSNGGTTITVTPSNGFNGSVTLSATGLPNGVTASFGTNPTTSTTSLTFAASAGATTGTVTVTVTGISSSLTHTTTVTLTVTGPSDFSLSASPTSVSVGQGSQSTSAITSTVTGGFSGVISLSASGQPTGVTVSFNPTSITGAGNSTMTMTVGSSVAAGTYSITVTGTSGGSTHTTGVSLTVTTLSNFTISASPTSLTVHRSNSGTSTVTTTISGSFNSAIGFSASVGGSNIAITFNPSSIAAPGSGSSTMTIKVASRAKVGSRTITITGTGGGKTQTTTIILNVT